MLIRSACAETIQEIHLDNYFVKRDNNIVDFKLYKDNDIFLYSMYYIDNIKMNKFYTQEYLYEEFFHISKEKWNHIKNIVYFGFGYNNHTSTVWYILTQALIYKELNYNIEVIDENNISVFKKYEKEYNELLSLVQEHEKLPKFYEGISEINFNYGDKYWIDSAVLNDFYLAASSTINLTTIESENYIVAKYPSKAKLYWERKVSDKTKNVVYYNDESSFIARGGPTIYIDSIKVNVHGGKIKIINASEYGDYLHKSKFSLYDSNNKKIATFKTNNKGIAESDFLPRDSYYLIQESVCEDCELINDKIKINFTDFGVTEVSVTNFLKKAKLKINLNYSFYEDTQVLPESKSKFEVIRNNEVISSGVTDANGELYFWLPIGNYIIRQINSGEGFALHEDILVEIIDYNDQSINIRNYKEKPLDNDLEIYTENDVIILDVPNTGINFRPIYIVFAIIFLIIGFLCYVKKK